MASYLYRYEVDEITEERISEVCECLLRLFTVLELSAAGYSSTNFKTFLFKENIKLVDKSISVEEIKNDFKQQIENHWKREELKEAIALI